MTKPIFDISKISFPINMYDPTRDYNNFKNEYDNAISTVLSHGKFINGPEVDELEKKLSDYVGVKHCITVANGTDALQIALMSLGVSYGDEIITVSFTWISTAESISILGAIPVFVDIDENTFCIDIDQIETALTFRTKAIVIVSLFGLIPNMDKINQLSEMYKIPIIEDGAQSFGAIYKGKKSCGLSLIGTTSFFPSKPLGCYGDGGACFTNDDALAIKMRAIKNHGGTQRFHHKYIGLNSRLDTIHAAILNVKFDNFEDSIYNRNSVAKYYLDNLKDIKCIKLPEILCDQHVWSQFSILLENKDIRDAVFNKLKESNINVAIFYPTPLHTQECFADLDYTLGRFPVTESVCDRIINLPCYAELTYDELTYIVYKFKEALE